MTYVRQQIKTQEFERNLMQTSEYLRQSREVCAQIAITVIICHFVSAILLHSIMGHSKTLSLAYSAAYRRTGHQ